MSAQPVLAVSGLSRSYGELEALRGLQLEIGEGECVAVIGHNGSGKTTAVRIAGSVTAGVAGPGAPLLIATAFVPMIATAVLAAARGAAAGAAQGC